jgi:hypothetical protein
MAVKITFGEVPPKDDDDTKIVMMFQKWLNEQAQKAEAALLDWEDKPKGTSPFKTTDFVHDMLKKHGKLGNKGYARAMIDVRKQWSLAIIEVMG